MNDKVKLGVALALLVGCGVYLSYYYSSKTKAGDPVAHAQPLACAACGASFAGEASSLPTICQKCGKKEAYRALKCLSCKAVFPLVRASESFGDQAAIKCTKCGKSKFTTEIPPNDLQNP